jgi:hypothetical protein
MNRIEAVTIAPRALQSPPPHERIDISKIPVHDDHESAMSGSASSGATAFSTAHASAFRQPLNSSTSTAMTAATTASSSTLGGDEMLMALLASQAAVDCDALPIGAWDDVESWKKVRALDDHTTPIGLTDTFTGTVTPLHPPRGAAGATPARGQDPHSRPYTAKAQPVQQAHVQANDGQP